MRPPGTGDCLARFLLGVEEGCILGTEGWDASYAHPLGDPLGPRNPPQGYARLARPCNLAPQAPTY